jgi:predicted sugar kinase
MLVGLAGSRICGNQFLLIEDICEWCVLSWLRLRHEMTCVDGGSLRGASVACVLSRRALAKLRLRAIRRGVWFRDLKDVERKLLDLTIAVVRRIHSVRLARMVSAVVEKLLNAVESKLSRLMRTHGRELAEKLSRIAQNWGNKSAVHWARDLGFMEYLTLASVNSTVGSEAG